MNFSHLAPLSILIFIVSTEPSLSKLPKDYQAYPTDAEIPGLPPFCEVKLRKSQGSPEYKDWERRLGPDFIHSHHLCSGINFINRYYRAQSNEDKNFNLKSSVGEFDYMVTHASPSYSLMPDVYFNRGLAYSFLKKHAPAITDLNKSIELNPHQPRPYVALAELYIKLKQKNKALEIVTAGLRHNPNTKSLERKYTELGGTFPYPEPIQVKTAEAEIPTKQEDLIYAKPMADAIAPPASTPTNPTPTPDPSSKPKPGKVTNPYCRFCPD